MCWGNKGLAVESFYGAISVIAGLVVPFLYTVIWRKAVDRIKELDGVEGQQATIWLGDIWTTDIKQGVQELFSFISSNIVEELENDDDKFEVLFTHTGKAPVLKKKLQDLTTLYQGYSDNRDLLGKSRQRHETIKTWTLRTIVSLISISVWGAIGLLVTSTFLIDYSLIYWLSIIPLLIILAVFAFKLSISYTECCKIDSRITAEKSKHSDALGVVL